MYNKGIGFQAKRKYVRIEFKYAPQNGKLYEMNSDMIEFAAT